jgi:hypothetical protein
MTRPLPCLLAAALVATASADPYVGFVDMASVFRAQGLDPALRTSVTVWAGPSPKAPAVATLEAGSGGVYEFPVVGQEIDYEESSAKVFDTRVDGDPLRPWVQVELADGTRGWVTGEEAGIFRELGKLYEESLVDSTRSWGGALHGLPGGPVEVDADSLRDRDANGAYSVDVLGSTRLEGFLWLRVRLLRENPCEGTYDFDDPANGFAEGWAPFFDLRGRENFHRFSRGC